jgi:hypothetical protein
VTDELCADCEHPESSHQPEFGCWEPDCECLDFDDEYDVAEDRQP